MKHPIGINTNTYHGFTFDEAVEGIAAAGFKYVELAAVRGWTEHIMPDMPADELDAKRRKLQDLGLTCFAVSGHCNLMDAERLNDFRDNMKLAHSFGAKYIISSTGEAHFGKDESFADDVLIKNITALLPDLEKYDMELGLEVHGEYGTGESLYRIAKGVASPRVGVNYDTANVVFYGGKEPQEEIKTCIDGLTFVHLKDKGGADNEWNFPAVGSGRLKLLDFISYVDTNGYAGPMSIEIEYQQEFCTRVKDQPGDLDYVNAQVKSAYDYLAKNGVI